MTDRISVDLGSHDEEVRRLAESHRRSVAEVVRAVVGLGLMVLEAKDDPVIAERRMSEREQMRLMRTKRCRRGENT